MRFKITSSYTYTHTQTATSATEATTIWPHRNWNFMEHCTITNKKVMNAILFFVGILSFCHYSFTCNDENEDALHKDYYNVWDPGHSCHPPRTNDTISTDLTNRHQHRLFCRIKVFHSFKIASLYSSLVVLNLKRRDYFHTELTMQRGKTLFLIWMMAHFNFCHLHFRHFIISFSNFKFLQKFIK